MEMQRFFIKIRDEICKNGEILLSPALSYTHRHLQNAIDKQKKEKLPKEVCYSTKQNFHTKYVDFIIMKFMGIILSTKQAVYSCHSKEKRVITMH